MKHQNKYFLLLFAFIFKPFKKKTKNLKTIKQIIWFFTPNYEVLIHHGYVGKKLCLSKSKIIKKIYSFFPHHTNHFASK